MEDAKSCRVSSPDPYQDQAFFLHTFAFTKVLGDLHHLLPGGLITYDFLLIKVNQPKNLFSLKMIFLKSSPIV